MSLAVIARGSAGTARSLPDHLHPRTALVLLGGGTVLVAAASTTSLALLVAAAIAQIPQVARIGEWSPDVLALHQPWAIPIGALAALVLAALLVRATVTVAGLVRRYRLVVRDLPADPRSAADVVVVVDPMPYAVAQPRLGRRPGHVVVSSGMLDGLRDDERGALVAHERAHIAKHHHVVLGLAAIAEALNPLLAPWGRAVAYAAERCADEEAVRSVGDRGVVARAVGHAALLVHRAGPAMPAWGPGMTSGPVPRRVGALLVPPPTRSRRLGLVAALLVLAAAVALGATLDAGLDLHGLLETAEYGD
ncbi:M56 family metallopeptidase [Actinomycetospora sp. CA-053990]|uniref:M56 family metallopeptidase n=1 Tax=Actinomycetospora sp. CA-053990 TaxID=3239891 RepID=UPI003D8DB6B8